MTRFDWATDCPDAVRQVLEPHLVRHAALIPGWCEYVSIHYMALPQDKDDSTVAETQVQPEYRRCTLTIFGKWLESPPHYLERSVIHELLHIVNEPQRKCMRDLALLATNEREQLANYIREQVRVANEGQTEDMCNIIWKLTRQPE